MIGRKNGVTSGPSTFDSTYAKIRNKVILFLNLLTQPERIRENSKGHPLPGVAQ
jgi:hypothetical protein